MTVRCPVVTNAPHSLHPRPSLFHQWRQMFNLCDGAVHCLRLSTINVRKTVACDISVYEVAWHFYSAHVIV